MVSTVSDHVLKLMKTVPVVKNLEQFQLSFSVAGGSKLPYSGYVEVEDGSTIGQSITLQRINMDN
jgi:hypothetical protein